MKKLIWAGGLVMLMLAGSLLHVPQWVARAAAIYSSPTSNVIEAYRQPFESLAGSCSSSTICSLGFSPPPPGHRLVIQYVSVIGVASTTPAGISVAGTANGSSINFVVQPIAGYFNTTRQGLLFFDPSDTPVVEVFPIGQGSVGNVQATLMGYLENCSVYPNGVCPAIAH